MSGTVGSAGIPGPAGPRGLPGDPAPAGPHMERTTAVTDSSGQATFTWPAGAFTSPPVVALGVEAAAGLRSVQIISNTAAQTVVQATGVAVVELLGIQVLTIGGAAAGITVHAHAVES